MAGTCKHLFVRYVESSILSSDFELTAVVQLFFCFSDQGRRHYCSPEELKRLFEADHAVVRYAFQLERAPQTGRLHYQWYVRFSSAVSRARVVKLFPPESGVHCETCKGNEAQCVTYCTKEDSRVDGPWEYGENAAPGRRTDITRVREILEDGGGMREVAREIGSYQGIKCAEAILKYVEKERDFVTEVRWYYGSTGSGKTRKAKEEFPDSWMSGKNLRWFEGYDAHESIIVDDFRKDFCTFHELLRICDRYGYRVETKGGSRQLLAKTIIFTCPFTVEQLYRDRSEEDIGQLKRRISVETLFGEYVPTPKNKSVFNSACSANFRLAKQ